MKKALMLVTALTLSASFAFAQNSTPVNHNEATIPTMTINAKVGQQARFTVPSIAATLSGVLHPGMTPFKLTIPVSNPTNRDLTLKISGLGGDVAGLVGAGVTLSPLSDTITVAAKSTASFVYTIMWPAASSTGTLDGSNVTITFKLTGTAGNETSPTDTSF